MSRIPAGICANFKIDEHRFSTIGNDHGLYNIVGLTSNFSVQEKCNRKMDCLIYEMLFLRKKKPNLNSQSDSIRANLFV